jgi:hypothetical protein
MARKKHSIRQRGKNGPITIDTELPLPSAWGQEESVEVEKSEEKIPEMFAAFLRDQEERQKKQSEESGAPKESMAKDDAQEQERTAEVTGKAARNPESLFSPD